MKKTKILKLFACAFFAYNAHATESKDVLFSVFGTEMQASEMVERGFLKKKIIECENRVDSSTSDLSRVAISSKYDQEVYQLHFSSPNAASVKLKIGNENSKTTISLVTVDHLKSYAFDGDSNSPCVDYDSCLDYVLSGGREFNQDSEGKFYFTPSVHTSKGNIKMKANEVIQFAKTITMAGQNIIYSATSMELVDHIVSAGNETRLEVFSALEVAPIIRSIFIRSSETISPDYLCNTSYRTSLLDGQLDANFADISIYRFEDIKINFDSSIVND